MIPEKDLEEVRAIYQTTGAVSLMDAVEKGMEKKLGSKAEVEKYWQTCLETGDSRNVAALQVGCDRFYTTAHQQYSNNNSARPGIFLAGTATGSKAIMESITDGRSAASEVVAFLTSMAVAAKNGQLLPFSSPKSISIYLQSIKVELTDFLL
jgi:heterodisulfide reductase subunit A-like polyferredoxin